MPKIQHMFCRMILVLGVLLVFVAGAVRAGENGRDRQGLDFSSWRRMPVFEGGRMMPLDTFARQIVETICGRRNPRLAPGGDAAERPEVRELFPGGKARKFTAAELLLSWLVESDKWEHVPLLIAKHEQLRQDLLEAPIQGKGGRRLRHVSPSEFDAAARLAARLAELSERQGRARAEGVPLRISGLDETAARLNEAYTAYRLLTFNPEKPAVYRRRFVNKLAAAGHTWAQLEPVLRQWRPPEADQEISRTVARADEAVQKLVGLFEQGSFTLRQADVPAAALREAAAALADCFAEVRGRVFEAPDDENPDDENPDDENPDDENPAQIERFRSMMNTLAGKTSELARQAHAVHLALYDNGRTLHLVPALDRWALDSDRDPHDDAHPWLSLQMLVFGSDAALERYPRAEVAKARRAFERVKAIYTDRGLPDRPKRFAAAMEEFASSVRSLAEKIEPLRRDLPMRHKDERLLAATAYPPPGSTMIELRYNRLDPFLWSWVFTLGAVVSFGLCIGRLRGPMFWLGIVLLSVGQSATIYGLWLRAEITGMVPVANMFETVLFMGLTVAVFGLWFGLLPLFWPGLGTAWRLTAVPSTWEATPLGQEQIALVGPDRWSIARRLLLLVRLVLAIGVFYVLAVGSYGPSGDTSILGLLPRGSFGGKAGWSSAILLWLVGWCLLLWAVWFVPRAALAVLLSVVLVPLAMVKQGAKQGIAKPIEQTFDRKAFVVSGAWIGFLAYILAYFAPGVVFDREIGLGMAVLRNNFWLAVHVLTVTASYGAGGLAWGLGNVSLGYYLFGRYRDPAGPPLRCAQLASFIYKATQVAVVLLAAGTITGAIWADSAWGRYWGWDPKEVWALISLLVYLVVLHGRWAGWAGNFGLAMGAVIGATAITMAWYGVNFVLAAGLHSYGFGSGGQFAVGLVVAANWLFVLLAAIRYNAEIRAK